MPKNIIKPKMFYGLLHFCVIQKEMYSIIHQDKMKNDENSQA